MRRGDASGSAAGRAGPGCAPPPRRGGGAWARTDGRRPVPSGCDRRVGSDRRHFPTSATTACGHRRRAVGARSRSRRRREPGATTTSRDGGAGPAGRSRAGGASCRSQTDWSVARTTTRPAGPCDAERRCPTSATFSTRSMRSTQPASDRAGHAVIVERGQMVADLGHDQHDGRPVTERSAVMTPDDRSPGLDTRTPSRPVRAAAATNSVVAGLSHHDEVHGCQPVAQPRPTTARSSPTGPGDRNRTSAASTPSGSSRSSRALDPGRQEPQRIPGGDETVAVQRGHGRVGS